MQESDKEKRKSKATPGAARKNGTTADAWRSERPSSKTRTHFSNTEASGRTHKKGLPKQNKQISGVGCPRYLHAGIHSTRRDTRHTDEPSRLPGRPPPPRSTTQCDAPHTWQRACVRACVRLHLPPPPRLSGKGATTRSRQGENATPIVTNVRAYCSQPPTGTG